MHLPRAFLEATGTETYKVPNPAPATQEWLAVCKETEHPEILGWGRGINPRTTNALLKMSTGQLPCAFLPTFSLSFSIWESLTQSGRQNSRSTFTEEDRDLGLEKHREQRPVSFQVWGAVP